MKKQNLFKSMLLLCALVAGSGSVWAEDVLHYHLDGSTAVDGDGSNNNYSSYSTITQNGIEWKVKANTKESPWRVGGKNITSVDRDIYNTTAMDQTITKIDLIIGNATITVNSITLIVASDDKFTSVIDNVSVTTTANTTQTITPSAGKTWSSGSYYKFVYNVTNSGSSNKYVHFTGAKFYIDSTPATISAVGWTTFTSTYALNFTGYTAADAYMVTNASGTTLTLSQVTGTVPAETPLLISGTADATVNIPVTASSSTDVSANKLKKGTGAPVNAADKYVMVARGGKAVFAPTNENAATVPVGKAYLDLNGVTLAPEFVLDDSETTGIESVNSEVKGFFDGEFYNLSGQRVTKPAKGLYIVNGKKVIIK